MSVLSKYLPTYLTVGIFIIVATSARQVSAINIETAEPPVSISDGKLSLSTRSLVLPTGQWSYVAKHSRKMTESGVDVVGLAFEAYAMNVVDKQWNSGVFFTLNKNSMPTRGWANEPCKVENTLYKNTFDSSFKYPECLIIFKRQSHLTSTQGNLYPQAKNWAEKESIRMPSAVYEIAYFKYGTSDYGIVRYFIPNDGRSSDDQVIAFAKEMASSLRPLLANEAKEGLIPQFPLK